MKKIFTAVIFPIFIISLFFIDTPISNACSYAYETPEEKFTNADAVFLGEVLSVSTSVEQSTNISTSITTFDVSEYWKGNVEENTSVRSSHLVGASCDSFVGVVGTVYLVYADYNSGGAYFHTTEVGPVQASLAAEATASLGVGIIPQDTPAPVPTSSYFFATNLSFGSRGEDVRNLQKYLNQNGFTVSFSGAGSLGNETTYFGPATRSALAKFQLSKNISPAVGFFGPITRGVLNGG